MRPWAAPGYIEKRRSHREAMRLWYDDAVRRGFIDPDGDTFQGHADAFQALWDGSPRVQAEFYMLDAWALAEAEKRGFADEMSEDAPGNLALEIQDALDAGKDPEPLAAAWLA